MREIELSSMVQDGVLGLQSFSEQAFFQVRHRQMDWATGWNQILQIGLYQKGPDVSEVGSTWLENLKDMRALRPFSYSEIHALGGEKAFLSAAWPKEKNQSLLSARPSDPAAAQYNVASIPWLIDTRLVHFRRDLLAKAGVPEKGAFSTPEAMIDTLERLHRNGVEYPLLMATGGLTLHNLAGFVWGRGGSFRSEDYRKVTLTEPESRRGMADYFKLHRYIHPDARRLDYGGTDVRFLNGQGAVLLSGQWVTESVKDHPERTVPAVVQNYGCAVPPGVPYVGGTHLVIWRHSLHDMDAQRLIAYLTSVDVLKKIFAQIGNVPARVDALNSAPFTGDPDYQRVIECIRIGRNFRSAHLWAGVEMRVSALCDQLWSDLFTNPGLDLDAEIERRVRELAVRLEKTLLASW